MLCLYHSPVQPDVVGLVCATRNTKAVHHGIVPLTYVKTAVDALSPKGIVCATNDPGFFIAALKGTRTAFGRASAVDVDRACVGLFRKTCFQLDLRFPTHYEWVPFHVEEWWTWIDWDRV